MRLDAVVIGERVRKDMGDLSGLADSIRQHGLLHPVVVKTDGTLVAGHRRIEAARLLGWTEIPATVIEVDDLLSAERDENAQRKDFTPTEAVAIGRLIEERHRVRVVNQERARKRLGPKTKTLELNHREPVGQTRDIAARAVGFSPTTYGRAKSIVAAAEADPAKFGDLPSQMDETGNVTGAHREMERRSGKASLAPVAKRSRHAIHGKTHYLKSNETLRRAVHALEGICVGLEEIDAAHVDVDQVGEWARALEECATRIRRTAKRLRGQ